MIRRHIFAAAAGLSALTLAPQPLAAQEVGDARLGDVMELMAGMFQAEPLTTEQEARLPAAGALVAVMMPEGFYADMMGDMMDGMIGPIVSMFNGEAGAKKVLQSRLDLQPDQLEALSDEERIELAALLDPAFEKRGAVVGDMMRGVMADAAAVMEPLYREGLTKAYAARFDAAQLTDIQAFFSTPTGKVYAAESMKLLADPQVMSASMQAMPAMMGGMGDIVAKLEMRMAELPVERSWADLTKVEQARMAAVLGVTEAALGERVRDPAQRSGEGS